MPSWLVVSSYYLQSFNRNFTGWAPAFGALSGADSAAEANAQIRMPGAYTLSGLFVNAYANTLESDTVFTSRKNGAPGAQAVTVPAGTTGQFQDAVNSDDLADGDLIDTQIATGASSQAFHTIQPTVAYKLTAATNAPLLALNIHGSVPRNVTYYFPLGSYGDSGMGNVPESKAQYTLRKAATLSRLALCCYANSADVGYAIWTRVNGANGSQTLTVPASATGWFQDVVNSDVIAAGDRVNYQLTAPAGTAGSASFSNVQVKSQCDGRQVISAEPAQANTYAGAGPRTYYLILEGDSNHGTDNNEANHEVKALTPFTARNLLLNTQNNGRLDVSTFSLVKNGAATALSVSIPAGATGVFEDTTHSVSYADGDTLCYELDLNGANSNFYIDVAGFEEDSAAQPPLAFPPGLSPGAKVAALAGI